MFAVVKTKLRKTEITKLLLTAIFMVSLFYAYFLTTTIRAAVKSEKDFKNLQTLNREYQNTEEAYFGFLKNFDANYARGLSFVVQSPEISYAFRQNAVAYGKEF